MKIANKRVSIVAMVLIAFTYNGAMCAEKKNNETVQQDTKAALQTKLLQRGVNVRWKDGNTFLIVKGFPYRKDIKSDSTIEIIKVEKGVFTASDSSSAPTAFEGTGLSIAGGSFLAQCNAEDGTDTLADATGNTWIFTKAGMSFNVYLKGSKKPAYALRSKIKRATISFKEEGVLLKGFEFIVGK
jgi:hypothetical protein